jgi:hypothetical protein
MIYEKIMEVNERFQELNTMEANIVANIEKLNNTLDEIAKEKLTLQGSYSTLVTVGKELGEIEISEDGKTVSKIEKAGKEEQ